MNRAYPNKIDWENEPSTNTPINETNLNKIDSALYEIDGRVVTFDLTKANQSDLLQTVKNVTYDTETGIFTFTFWNGSTVTADLNIEKIPVSFRLTEQGVLIMTTADGTEYTCDIAALIKIYTFADSTEIDFTTTTDASGNKTITAQIKAGSITGDKLQPNYLADCVEAKTDAQAAATDADADALKSEGFAVGQQNGTDVPSTSPYYHNNAKWYSEQANPTTLANLTDTDIDNPQANQPLSYDGENWINNPNLMLVSSSEKASWNGSVADIKFSKDNGYLAKNLCYEITYGYSNNGGDDVGSVRNDWLVGNMTNTATRSCFAKVIPGRTYTVKSSKGNRMMVSAFTNADYTIAQTGKKLTNDFGTNPRTFTVPEGYNYVCVYLGNNFTADETPTVMIEEGSTASDYMPYAPSNIELGDQVNYLNENVSLYEQSGFLSKNLLPITLTDVKIANSGTWSDNVCTIRGVSFRVDTNNEGYVTKIVANNTATGGNANFYIPVANNIYKGCILSGLPKPTQSCNLLFQLGVSPYSTNVDSTGDGVKITVDNGNPCNVILQVPNTVSVSDLEFKPMIRYESVEDATFTPYAPSNTMLDTKKADISAIGTDESGRTTASKAYAIGEHFYKDGKFCTAKTAIASGATFTLNTNYVEGTIADEIRNKPDTVLPPNTNNNYETQLNHIYIKNGISFVNVLVKVTTPSASNHVKIAEIPSGYDIPPVSVQGTSVSFDGGFSDAPLNYVLGTDGNLIVRGGVTGCRYPVIITY